MLRTVAESDEGMDIGSLSNNYMFVNGLRSALSKSETNVSAVVKSLRVVIAQDCWRHWLDPDGKEVRWNAADFREFIKAPWPAGCGVPTHLVEKLLAGSDVLDRFRELIRGPHGAHEGNQNAAKPWVQTDRDVVTDRLGVDLDPPDVIPLSPDAPRPRNRDYSREAPTGNSVSYTIRRLNDKAPELAARVRAGELSAHAAAVQAGFHERKITVPHDPSRAARILVKHLDPASVKALIIALSHAAGFSIEHD